MGNWKLTENLAARMNTVTADEVRIVLNTYERNTTWTYIGDPGPGEQSFIQ